MQPTPPLPTSAPPPLSPVPPNGAAPAGRFANIPQSTPVDLSARAQALREVPKQNYGADAPPASGPAIEGTTMVPMRAETKRKSARGLLRVLDRLQANVFAVVAKNEDPDVFRMTETQFDDMCADLEDGVEQMNFQIPWYVGFLLGLLLLGWMNWQKARKIREERETRERLEAKEQAEREVGTVRAAIATIPVPKATPPRPAPRPSVPHAVITSNTPGAHACKRDGCANLAAKDATFCSQKCNGMHQAIVNRRKRAATQAAHNATIPVSN